jgi:hypothetical protein
MAALIWGMGLAGCVTADTRGPVSSDFYINGDSEKITVASLRGNKLSINFITPKERLLQEVSSWKAGEVSPSNLRGRKIELIGDPGLLTLRTADNRGFEMFYFDQSGSFILDGVRYTVSQGWNWLNHPSPCSVSGTVLTPANPNPDPEYDWIVRSNGRDMWRGKVR